VSGASRAKGLRGEHEFRAIFERYGWSVVAAQRNLGGAQGDALAMRGGVVLHLECKRRERINVWELIAQMEAEAGTGTLPVGGFRRNRSPWYGVVRLDTLAERLA